MALGLELLSGINAGYTFAFATQKEAEVRQGKNYYQSAFFQANQITQLGTVASALSNTIPSPYIRGIIKIATTGTQIISWAACPVFAAAKQGHLESGMTTLRSAVNSKAPKVANYLPQELNKGTEKAFTYLAENIGTHTKTAMVVGSLALPITGNIYLASGIMAPLLYQTVDHRGWVPRRVSLFIETYMPMVARSGALVGGTPFGQGIAALNALSYSSTFNKHLHKKIDGAVHSLVNLPGPSIEEIEAPVRVNMALTFDQINNILHENNRQKFKVNPAHCSKRIGALKTLSKNYKFDQLLDLFEKVNWVDEYPVLKNAFFQDDRFISYVRDQFPHEKDVADQLEVYLEKLASAGEVSKEQFLANQLKKQMESLVQVLKGECRAQGSQKDTDEAIDYCSQILAYLQQLNLEDRSDCITCKDTLSKLAIEGGQYCALGIKRASKEIVNGILQWISNGNNDVAKNYERQLQQALETARERIVNNFYLQLINLMAAGLQGRNVANLNEEVVDGQAVAAAQDVHTQEIYRIALAYGVVPLSDHEDASIGMTELNLWGNPGYPFREIRSRMYRRYHHQIPDVIKELGHLHFFNYLRLVIEKNQNLTPVQKEEVLEKFTERNDDRWSLESTQGRFNRLVCVMLGVLNYDSISNDWIRMDAKEAADYEEYKTQDWVVV